MMTWAIRLRQVLRIFQSVFLLFLISSCSQEKAVTVGTGGTSGNYYKTGLAIATIVNKARQAHGLQLEVKDTKGSVSNIDAIMSGEFEFGFAQADRQYQAVHGLAEWSGKGPQKDLRAVFSLYTESVTLIAGRDAGINTVYNLKGQSVDIGPPGSGIRQNAIDALGAAGIDWEKDIRAHGESSDDRVRMLINGELDALFHTVGHPSNDIWLLTASRRGVRFIPLVNIDKLVAKYPYYSRTVIPVSKLYRHAAHDKDVNTVGVKATFLTSAKIPDKIVYAITKAVFDDLDGLGYVPILKTLRKNNMLEGLTAPIHPGALKYYREIGLEVPSPQR